MQNPSTVRRRKSSRCGHCQGQHLPPRQRFGKLLNRLTSDIFTDNVWTVDEPGWISLVPSVDHREADERGPRQKG